MLKRKICAVLFSLIVPGSGHIHLGLFKRGFLLFSISLFWRLFVAFYLSNSTTRALPDYISIFELIFCLYIAFDAYKHANKDFEQKKSITGNAFLMSVFICGFLLVTIGLALLIRTYFIQPFRIPAASMSPTILVDDRVLVNKMAYKNSAPQRGDVIAFIFPMDRTKTFLKRVIGLPGESIEIKDGKIYINGKEITDGRIKDIYYYNRGDYGMEGQIIEIPEGKYFVMGDNSSASHDSRYWGLLSRNDIKGKAYKIFNPVNRSGPIE